MPAKRADAERRPLENLVRRLVEKRETEMAKWIVLLESGVYLAAGQGDPARTVHADSARQFDSHPRARNAMRAARKHRPFVDAKVTLAQIEVQHPDELTSSNIQWRTR